MLDVQVEANPAPTITWQKDGADFNLDERISKLENGSLNIATSQISDSGTWTIIADNGLGQVARKQIALKVHPSRMPIEVKEQKIAQSLMANADLFIRFKEKRLFQSEKFNWCPEYLYTLKNGAER